MKIKKLSITASNLFIFIGILLLVTWLFVKYKSLFIFFSLLFLAAISRTYNHFFWLPQLGLEFYSGATILTAQLLGPLPGLVQGILSQLFAYLLSGKIKFYTIYGCISWGVIGFITGFLSCNISYLGIFFVLLYDLISMPLFIASGSRITSSLFHFFTHQLINLFIFTSIVPLLYQVLK